MVGQGLYRFWTCVYALMPCTSTTKTLGIVGDGREKAMLNQVLAGSEEGNPEDVLRAVDLYCRQIWLMCVGSEKGLMLDAFFKERNPRVVLELGAYCGYSAIRMARRMSESDCKVISLEMCSDNADTARQLVQHAGLSAKVTVVEGILSTRINEMKQLLKQMTAAAFEFVFIDHDKDEYLPDYLLLKQHGLIAKGTILVADNMIIPGAPDYRKYLKQHPEELETVEHKCRFEYMRWLPDSMMVSIVR